MPTIEAEEVAKIQQYMQTTFKNKGFALKMREKATASAEVLLDGEFIGVVYKDDEEGDISYNFSMAILSFDLPGSTEF